MKAFKYMGSLIMIASGAVFRNAAILVWEHDVTQNIMACFTCAFFLAIVGAVLIAVEDLNG